MGFCFSFLKVREVCREPKEVEKDRCNLLHIQAHAHFLLTDGISGTNQTYKLLGVLYQTKKKGESFFFNFEFSIHVATYISKRDQICSNGDTF